MGVRETVQKVIGRMPNLLSRDVVPKYSMDPSHIVHTHEEVAARIASVLPGLLAAERVELVELPAVVTDEYGDRGVRVPLAGQPWADGQVRAGEGTVILSGIPTTLTMQDVPTVVAALLAVWREMLDTQRAKAREARWQQ